MGKTTGQPLLKNGSTGSDVKKLQQSPKTLGSLYGEPKEVALSDDGSGSYVGTNAGTGEENVTEEVAQPPTFNYTPSDTVIAANKVLADQWNSMPGAYQSQWNSKINDYMSKIENRDPFSYNFNEDGLYQMYKDHYTQMGQMAMMDTMGQAAAMTGGYGNSYAQTVGQQAYNQQLTQLNNIIPELYQMAYARYRDEVQDLLNMYNMYMDRENQDYGRYKDNLSNWWKETDYLAGRADTEYNRDYKSQWDSYTAGSKGNGNGNGDDTTKYDALGYEDQKKWEKDFSKATSYPELERIGDRMQQAGVDPQVVADWVDYYANLLGLVPENNQQMSKPTTGGLGGGGGGGRIMIEAW